MPAAGRQVFANFLNSEFSEENMDFWRACEEYKKTAPSNMATRAKHIYQQYITADASNEVIYFIHHSLTNVEALFQSLKHLSGNPFNPTHTLL